MNKIPQNYYTAAFRGGIQVTTDYIRAANIRQAAMVAVYQGNVRHLIYEYIDIIGEDTNEKLTIKKGGLLK
ncbi:hypothetical protein [Hominenteromicrobium sp.]|uniref:hypothetical protein n=1 Tax=Hominenteromicrobium sp. TaxID=3073581 RepID=UPI003A8CD136